MEQVRKHILSTSSAFEFWKKPVTDTKSRFLNAPGGSSWARLLGNFFRGLFSSQSVCRILCKQLFARSQSKPLSVFAESFSKLQSCSEFRKSVPPTNFANHVLSEPVRRSLCVRLRSCLNCLKLGTQSPLPAEKLRATVTFAPLCFEIRTTPSKETQQFP